MTDNCKYKPAAASINWFAGLLKGKSGTEHKETLSALSQMLHTMKAENCDPCLSRDDCHDLDKAMKAITEREPSKLVSSQGPVGSLLIRKEHNKKLRLIRPFGK